MAEAVILGPFVPFPQDGQGSTLFSDRLCCIRKKKIRLGPHINRQQLYLVYFSSERNI